MKTNRENLKVGGVYLHKNGQYLRKVISLSESHVGYTDNLGSKGTCSVQHFIRTCPSLPNEDELKTLGGFPDVHAGNVQNKIEKLRQQATLIAMLVRNNLEDFHVKHLSNSQMKELNPLIRDAIFTCLHAMAQVEDFGDEKAKQYLWWTKNCIPDYWEVPVLMEDYSNFIDGIDVSQ